MGAVGVEKVIQGTVFAERHAGFCDGKCADWAGRALQAVLERGGETVGRPC